MTGPARPHRVLSTSVGTHLGAFGRVEWALLAGTAVIWGSSFLLMEIGLRSLQPAVVSLCRVGLGAATLALLPQARRGRVERRDLAAVAVLGVAWMGIPLLLFPLAQQWIDSSVAGMINGAMPLTVAAWAAVLLHRRPGPTQAVGLLVGFLGVTAIALPQLPVGALADGTAATALGTGLVLTAMVLYGLAANLAVPLQQRYGALAVLLRAELAALVVIAPFGLASLGASTFTWEAVAAMLPLGILGTALGFVLMTTLVGRVGGPRGSIATYFVPVVAMLLGVVALGEVVHPAALVGLALVLVGAWITSRREPH